MNQKFLAYCKLIRLPNLCTVPGDIFLGTLIVSFNSLVPIKNILFLVLTSLCLYSFGMVQNDIIGFFEDVREKRKNRPLVSNEMSLKSAYFFAVILLFLSLFFAFFCGKCAFFFTISLLFLITFYNLLAIKKCFISLVFMGLCRAANVVLGMSLAQEIPSQQLGKMTFTLFIPAILVGLYIFIVSYIAKDESENKPILGFMRVKSREKLVSFLLSFYIIFQIILTIIFAKTPWLITANFIVILVALKFINYLLKKKFYTT